MQMSIKAGKIFFVTSGIMFLLFSFLLIWSSILTDSFFIGHELVFVGAAVMCFCLANLYPHFSKKGHVPNEFAKEDYLSAVSLS